LEKEPFHEKKIILQRSLTKRIEKKKRTSQDRPTKGKKISKLSLLKRNDADRLSFPRVLE
jgi:hypothetical protein